MEYELKTIAVADLLNWKVVGINTKGNEKVFTYRKYLLEAITYANDTTITEKQYYESLEYFKELVEDRIETTASGEYSLAYSKSLVWYHRNKSRLIHSLFEHTLKRWCLDDGLSISQSLHKTYEITNEDIFYTKA